jgi:carotenoid cleavage dioxygenase
VNAPLRLNRFLSGNYAPIDTEDDFHDLPVVGSIPKGLSGTFFRTGPNPQFPPRDQNHHWFAGDGMVHGFRISDGRASYFNRYVRTPKWLSEHEAGRSLFGTFGNPLTTEPEWIGKDSGVANTNVIWHAGKLLALEEGHQPFELDPQTLASRGYLDYASAAKRFTAHPKIDPETGELVFFAYMAGETPLSRSMAYGVVDKQGVVTRLDRFEAPFASMVHDFLVTKSYALFPVLPLVGDLERAMRGGPPFAWEPDRGAFVGVLARNASVETIRWFTTDPTYVFHPMNAWEDKGKIHAHVMLYERAPLFPNTDGTGANTRINARLALWILDLNDNSNTVKCSLVDDLPGEFPRLDERRAGLSYRHGYFAANTSADADTAFNSVAHIDHRTGKRAQYEFPRGDEPGEPVFVPKREGSAEGDGLLLSVVYRGERDKSDVVIFDANDVSAGPVTAINLPRRVPFGFHGNWVAHA